MKTPLYEAVKQFAERQNNISFHMPSHFVDDGSLYLSAKYDLTELEGLDNLMHPKGVIAEAEKLLADTYKSNACLMLTGGATEGILIALYMASQISKKIIIESTAHVSVYNGIRLFNLEPIILRTRYDADGLPLPVDIGALKAAIEQTPTASVLVTTPNYFGRVAELEQVKKSIKGLFIADGAHGAHFPYSKLLPKGAYEYADLCVCGMHKTLPCYTGSAVLCVGKSELAECARSARLLLQSTSPSYVIMASIDYARGVMSDNGAEWYESLKKEIDNIEHVKTDDFTRLVLDGGNGRALERYLAAQGIVCEFSFGRFAVLITKPKDENNLVKVKEALKGYYCGDTADVLENFEVERAMSYNAALNARQEVAELNKAVGRIAGQNVGLYPPASPIIIAGDKISEEQIRFLKKQTYGVYGLANGGLCVLK